MKQWLRNKNWAWLCKYNHRWEFDGGKWIIKDVSVTTRKCTRCDLKQDMEHYHLLPNYRRGENGYGIAVLHKERRPGDKDYDLKYEMNERPT